MIVIGSNGLKKGKVARKIEGLLFSVPSFLSFLNKDLLKNKKKGYHFQFMLKIFVFILKPWCSLKIKIIKI